MGDPIRNNPGRTSTSHDLASSETPATPATPATPTMSPALAAEPHEQADQAAADLDALTAAHQRRSPPRRRRRRAEGLRSELAPERVARSFVEVETNRARFVEAERSPFFEAMAPAERTEFMEQFAGKLADVAVGHMQGVVEVFNDIRDGFNTLRAAEGEAALPHVDLNSESMRAMLQHGIEQGLEAGVHAIIKTVLHTVLGHPSRLPHPDDPASSLEALPALEHPNVDGLNLRWSQPF